MACYHIIVRHASMRTGPALKRCHRTRKAAEAVRQRGATGDRADYSLDPGQTLGVVECYDKGNCECAKWPQGHNAAAIPVKPARNLIMCKHCQKGRRNAVEMIDPKTEESMLLCQRCAERASLGYLFKRQLPPIRRIHADDPALAFVVSSSVG